MRILIADDDVTSRAMLTVVLKKHGHEVIETASGVEAWEVMRGPESPQLAILDWMMPEMDGIDVVRRVRELATENPPYLIMLTARGKKSDIVEGLDAGANDYLAKPFDPGELRSRVAVGQRMVELQSALLESRSRLEHEATHDALTGILNRRAVLERLETEIVRAEREGAALSVGLCDLDYFKRINDTYGHKTGDDALRHFVTVLRGATREYDLVGRLGGEEFLVAAPRELFERIRAAVQDQPLISGEGPVVFTVSIGVAPVSPGSTVDELLEKADDALYRAKEIGRNRVVESG